MTQKGQLNRRAAGYVYALDEYLRWPLPQLSLAFRAGR